MVGDALSFQFVELLKVHGVSSDFYLVVKCEDKNVESLVETSRCSVSVVLAQ